MESSSQEDGGQFYWALGDLKFSPTSGGLSQVVFLKFFSLFLGGQQGFLYWGNEGVSSPLAKNLLIPPPGKVTLPTKLLFSTPLVRIFML